MELRARGVATAVVKLGGKGLAVAGKGIENPPRLQGHAHRYRGRRRQLQRRLARRSGTGPAS